jgi:hypothetical protein
LLRIVNDREAELPGRPLVLVLGSSRTKLGLRAGRLNHPEDTTAPVVVNAAQLGGGPMQHLAMLRRLLNHGIRPQMIFLEIMPMALSARDGRPMEERVINLSRFSASEVARMWPYCARPFRFCYPWALVRLWPCQHYRSELREALKIDSPSCGLSRYLTCTPWGWESASPIPPQNVAAETQATIETHRLALAQPRLAPGAVRAFSDVIDLCQRERIAVVLFMPPENSGFRNYAPDVAACQVHGLRELAGEFGVPLLDGRTWVDDDGFNDGHHANDRGADQFTACFAREALVPYRYLVAQPARYASNDLR